MKLSAAKKGKGTTTHSVDIEQRDPHHTEAQIAAKKKKGAAGAARSVDIEERDPHHTEAQM
jgi:hypothetical protein